jgi:serine/threonine protein kinase
MQNVPREIGPGTLIAGKYRVQRLIATGGQGTVVEAMHMRLNQLVAIKFPHVADDDLDQRTKRLFREARAAFRLRGEHVARVIDADVDAKTPFIVMEYLHGVDLKQLIATRGPLPCDEAVGLMLQACEAVAEAHDQGIVHRDLKPSNLFLTTRCDGTPLLKILDFGISKMAQPDGSADLSELTAPLRMMGSPRYMSPEQIRDARTADARADVWALGLILQELITAKPVFRARGRTEVLALILTKSPTPISLLRPDVPLELERILLRCMQRNPDHRFVNARDLAHGLAPFAPSWAAVNVERLSQRTRGRAVTPIKQTTSERVESPPPASLLRSPIPAVIPAERSRIGRAPAGRALRRGVALAGLSLAVVGGVVVGTRSFTKPINTHATTRIENERSLPTIESVDHPGDDKAATAVASPAVTTAAVQAPHYVGAVARSRLPIRAIGQSTRVASTVRRERGPSKASAGSSSDGVASTRLAPPSRRAESLRDSEPKPVDMPLDGRR